MKFSVFDHDETMGSAAEYGPLFRDVSVRIEGNYQSTLPGWSIDNNAAGIKQTLNNKGWNVEQVTNVSSGWFPGISGFTYTIFAVVGRNYTDRQIQDQVTRDLTGFFNVSAISVISAPYVPTYDGGGLATVTVNGTAPVANYGNSLPGASASIANQPGIGGGDFLSNLGLGVGVSTPIVVGGAALLLLLMLKR